MQQNFFSLGPDDGFGSMDVRPQNMMAHTPTTSSMLAALQQDSYSASLDPSASSYHADGYGSMGFMDTTTHEDPLGSGHQSGLGFSDFAASGSSFDVPFTSQDLGLGTPASEPDQPVQEAAAAKATPAS
jgi:regulatory factor X